MRRLPVAARASLGFLALLLLFSIAAPLVLPLDPNLTDTANSLRGPYAGHLLGTDELGRDVLTRVICGARASISGAVLATAVALVLGVPLGLLAGYAGRWVDMVIMRVFDAVLTFPGLVLSIALTSALGPNLRNSMLAVGIVGAPMMARLARSQVLSVREEQYVKIAISFGASRSMILWRHIFPNSMRAVLVQASLFLGIALLAEAALSYLGLGVQPPDASWGTMLQTAQRYVFSDPLQMLVPGLAITAAVLAFNTFGEGLRAALDPRTKTRSSRDESSVVPDQESTGSVSQL